MTDRDIENNIINSAANSIQDAVEVRKLVDITFQGSNDFIEQIDALCNKICIDQTQILSGIERKRRENL